MNRAPGKLDAMARVLAIMVSAAWLLAGFGVEAQEIVTPDEVVIYVHSSVKNDDFVEGLVCELGRVLKAPVSARTTDLPMSPKYLASRTQYDPRRIAIPFGNSTRPDDRRVFKFLILPYDLKVESLNYVFAETYMKPYFIAVMSTIRLTPDDSRLSRKRVSDVTGDRLYKLMLKSVARMAGLTGDGCVLAFPRSLPELDAKSAEFCPDDRKLMIDSGILKERPFGACNTVAMAGR